MANTATAQTAIPAIFSIGKPQGLITPVVVSMDTGAADLEVLAAATGKRWGIHGLIFNEATAITLQIKSGSTVFVGLEFTTFGGIVLPLSATPHIVGNVGGALNFNLSSGASLSALVYVATHTMLDLRS